MNVIFVNCINHEPFKDGLSLKYIFKVEGSDELNSIVCDSDRVNMTYRSAFPEQNSDEKIYILSQKIFTSLLSYFKRYYESVYRLPIDGWLVESKDPHSDLPITDERTAWENYKLELANK